MARLSLVASNSLNWSISKDFNESIDKICELLPEGSKVDITVRRESNAVLKVTLKTRLFGKEIIFSANHLDESTAIHRAAVGFKQRLFKEKEKKTHSSRAKFFSTSTA